MVRRSWRERELRGVKLREIQRETGVRVERLRDYLRHYLAVRGIDPEECKNNLGHYVIPREHVYGFIRFVEEQERRGRVVLVGRKDGSFEIVKG